MDIFRTARSTLYFEYPNTCIHHFIDESDGFQVLRTHYVFVVNLKLIVRFVIRHRVRTAAYLHTLATVGRAVRVVQTHIALTRNGHAQRTVTEHLDAHEFTFRSAYVLLHNLTVYLCHLLHIQLARQDHHIGKLGIELQSLHIADIELRRQMHLHPNAAAIRHHCHIAGYHRAYSRLPCRVYNTVHGLYVTVIYYGVHRQIGLYAMLRAGRGDVAQVIDGEMIGRVRPHIELSDTEINGVRARLYGCGKRLTATNGCHDFKVRKFTFCIHACKIT